MFQEAALFHVQWQAEPKTYPHCLYSGNPVLYVPCAVQTTVQDELAALEVETEQPEPAQFALNFLWLNKNIAVAVDQLFDEVTTIFCTVCPSSRQCCGRICWLHCLLCWLL